MGNQTPSPLLTDLDLLAPKPFVVTTPTDEWYFGKSTAPVVLSKKQETGSEGSQLRLNKKRGRRGSGKGGWKGPDLCYRSIWSLLSFSLSL